MATDPVCGMYVDERTAELSLVRENRTYFFCASACLEEFAAPEQRLRRLRWRLGVAWPLAAAVAILTYLRPFGGWPWVALVLASVVQFYPGSQFYRGTLDAARSRVWNMDVLIAVGTTVAYGYSLAALLLPTRLPPSFYFDASALIVALILTGNYLEHLTREKARGSLRRLRDLLPSTATVLRSGREVELPLSELQPKDRFLVRPGDRFPTDGVVVEGRSSANESLLTGESLPVPKQPGDAVIAAAINGEGVLTVEASRVGADTLLAQIGNLVAEAETSRVPLQQLADRIASLFVPTVLGIAVVATTLWTLGGAGLLTGLLVFVSVVIIACPCAFGIATPAAIVVGTGRAAEEGVLFKGRDSLEAASRIDLVLTDKTGTLTEGRPRLTDLIPAAGTSVADLLRLAGGLEHGSEHPYARAVGERLRDEGLSATPVQDVVAVAGEGVRGTWGGRAVAITAPGRAGSGNTLPPDLVAAAAELDRTGRSWSVVEVGGVPRGLLGFADAAAPGVPAALRALGEDGVRVVMVTGDRELPAKALARQVGLREVYSRMTPSAKVELIRKFRAEGHRVAFVGDGINDAPALAAADLGIAIGAGTEVAKETGGVILVRSDFRGVALALRIGRRTVTKVRGNLTWALGYNAVLLPVAAGALVPLWGLGVYAVLPVVGALAMALSSTSVVLNSLSLRYVRLTRRRPAAASG